MPTNSQLSTLQATISKLKQENSEFTAQINDLQASKQDSVMLSEKINELEQINDELNSTLTENYGQMEKLKDENFEILSKAKEQDITITQLTQYLSDTKDMLDHANMKIFEFEAINERIIDIKMQRDAVVQRMELAESRVGDMSKREVKYNYD